jgi:hypothetical protein
MEIEDSKIKIICLEQRVDSITREFINELKETNRLIEKLTDKVQNLENDRLKAQSFIAGAVFLATIIGGALAFIFQHLVGYKI